MRSTSGKTLLIVSSENGSTCDVMEWLDVYGVKYIRINEKDRILDGMTIRLGSAKSEFVMNINNKLIPLYEFDGVYVRHGFIDVKSNYDKNLFKEHYEIQENMKAERESFLDFIQHSFTSLPFLGKVAAQDTNKLHTLTTAAKIGLKIPETIVTNNRDELIEFKNKVGPIVCKSVQNVVAFMYDDKPHINYTSEVSDKDILEFPDIFYTSLFQQKLEKIFEIRSFYLGGEIYSMAILSQLDPQTSIDFRNYNMTKPNRTVPFKLPTQVESKLIELMTALSQQTGSIDMVVTDEKEFVLLEVNPVGQYGMVSYPCNYDLNVKMAEYLVTMMDAR